MTFNPDWSKRWLCADGHVPAFRYLGHDLIAGACSCGWYREGIRLDVLQAHVAWPEQER